MLENLFQEKWDEIKSNQLLKADKAKVENLQARISKLEGLKKEQDKVLIMWESYEKRFNVLIHGILDQEESAWETPLHTLGLIHTFMKKGLRIEDPTLIPLADYHRLPQRPIYDRTGAKIMRPIIIKLTNPSDKCKIYNNVKNLKAFNEERRINKLSSVYITEHLPKQFQQENCFYHFSKKPRVENKKRFEGRKWTLFAIRRWHKSRSPNFAN